ncbi:MAG: tetratricopeptide repeat protein [Bacteroidales bacterium]|nr:tetratricopeptide repeat protein [Bacteroidales bacterium]
MNQSPLLATAAAAILSASFTPAASGQVNSPDARGYLLRGTLMQADHNFSGSIDQTRHALDALSPDSQERENLLYTLCRAAVVQGTPDDLELVKEFLDSYPASVYRADVMSLRGDHWFYRGNWAEAVKEYSAIDPVALPAGRQDELNFRQGCAWLMLGDPDTAASLFRTIQSNPRWRDPARFYLGYIAYSKSDYQLALQYFNSIADTSEPPCDMAPYYIAQIHYVRGEYESALGAARQLLASNAVPEYQPECNRIAGESLYALGRVGEAVPYLWKYCAAVGNDNAMPSAFYILGVNEYESGHTSEAIKLLQRAVGLDSAMGQSAWLYLGQAYRERGDNSQAMLCFEKACSVDHDSRVRETAYYNYAVALAEGGRVPFGNSVKVFEGFLNEFPGSQRASEVRRYLVDGYMSENDYAAALQAINRDPSPSQEMLAAKQRVLFVLGTREYSSGHVAEAITHLREAADLHRYNSSIARQATLWLGDCYYTRHNYDGAARCYLDFIHQSQLSSTAVNPSDMALAYYDLGYTRFAQEKYQEALTDFSEAYTRIKNGNTGRESLLPDLLSRIADCRYYQGDYSGAAADYTRSYDLNPAAGDYVLYQLAVMKGLLKDHAGKIATIDQLAERFPSSGLLPQALLEKAESQAALGNLNDAINTYGYLAETYPGTAPGRNGYLQLAITFINNGQREKGLDTYRSVIRRFPSSEEARIAADDLKQIYASQGRLNELVKFLESVPDAPRYEASELERSAYEAAENAYLNQGSTTAIKAYLNDYPKGLDRANALYYMADAAWNEGHTAEALDYASKVLLSHPDSEVAEDALLIKAEAESETGKTELAYSSFLELESHASGSNMLHDARMGLLRTAMDLSRYTDAAAVADKLLASTATNSPADIEEVKFTRALANERLGNHDKAEADWTALAASPAELYGAKSAYQLAQSRLDRGNLEQAKSAAEALISSDTPHRYWLARGFVVYSDILRREGNTFEADEYLKSLRSNYPGTEADIFQMIDDRLK